jgi:short-chain Z-isoprenyl diphosphate synthase
MSERSLTAKRRPDIQKGTCIMHLGLIMDGNRRWARREGLSRREEHQCGYAHALTMLDACLQRKIEYASLFLLAKRNIKERTPEELNDLYALLADFVREYVPKVFEVSRP